ncbi:MAG: regulatory protein RecX [Stagnimonas sp.]|nr:regulatory protein RecX [Stagnimonas sp.]
MRRKASDEPLSPEAARLKAMRLLGRREHSARELGSKLRQGGVEAELTTEVVESMTENGWQSDPRFAASRIQNRIAQGFGPIRISAELRVAGLPDALIREAMEAAECDWATLCIETYQRKYRQPPADRAEKQKRYNHLAARGFTGEHIRAAFDGGDDDASD